MDTPETKFSHRHWSGVGLGLAVMAVGVIFLLRNFGLSLPFLDLHNWWALFILIGAVPSLAFATQRFRASGRFDAAVRHALLSALAVIMVALFFLLELDWGKWWPLFVIYGGLWLLVGKDGGREPPPAAS